VAEEWSPNPALASDDEIARCILRDAWAAWWRNTDGPALLAAFRRRTLGPAQTDQVRSLIAQLTDRAYARREAAAAALAALRPPLAPSPRQARRGADLGQTRRLQASLKRLAASGDQTALPPGAARLLALRRPAGATEALLAYLPFTDDAVMRA